MQNDVLYRGYRVTFNGSNFSAEPNKIEEDFIHLSSHELITVIDAIDVIHGINQEIPVWLERWVHGGTDPMQDSDTNYIDLDAVFRPTMNLPKAIANALDTTATEIDEPWPLDPEHMSYSPSAGKVSF